MTTLAYTLGEPAGIGADIIISLCQREVLSDLICIGDADLLRERAAELGMPLRLADRHDGSAGSLAIRHQPLAAPARAGHPDIANVPAILTTLDTAVHGCVTGEFAGMVTGPLHKGVINDAGIAFSGHTEYLAERTDAVPVMLLATEELRVALITTHLPLKDVSAAITGQRIERICSIVEHDLRTRFSIAEPRLVVCGLNPHAGEGGHLGHEEIDTIIPALERLKASGMQVQGPLPADTAFTPHFLQQADVVIAMYHDQGLPVLKSHGFNRAANITLGLPIVRTSVDHGTAFDLAGKGGADTGSLLTAIRVARQMTGSEA